jgi:hypothetical protein
MTEDEKLIRGAWDIYKQVLSTIKFSDNITWEEDNIGKIILTYNCKIDSELGTENWIKVSYCPPIDPILVLLRLRSSEVEKFELDEAAHETTSFDINKCYRLLFGTLAREFVRCLVISFAEEVNYTFERILDIPFLMLENVRTHLKVEKSIPPRSFFENREFEAHSAEILRKRQNRVRETFEKRINFSKEFISNEVHIIGFFYKSLYPLWEEVKDFYKKISFSTKWRELIQTQFGFVLPTNLIERLVEQDKYNAAPARLAREHAAFLCELPERSERTLERQIKRNLDWIEKNPDEAKSKIKLNFDFAFAFIEISKELTGEYKNVDSLKLPPFPRFLFENNINSYEDWGARLNSALNQEK